MFRPTFKSEAFILIFLAILVFASFQFYQIMPDKVPMHWNIRGEVDSYGGKAVGAFLIPGIIVLMYLLFLALPMLDPKKERYAEFAREYHVFKTLFIVFMAFIYLLTSLASIGFPVNISVTIPLAIGVLFIGLGYYMDKIKSNWFIGIRTPWTLSSEKVWKSTHKLGSWMFILAGLILMITSVMPAQIKIPALIAAVVAAGLVPVVYSYFAYAKEKK